MSDLLVVFPTLGVSHWLNEAVASAGRLTVARRLMLVCPADVRAGLEQRFPQAQVVAEPGGGMYAAINAGMAAAGDWDFVTYLNDDDLIVPAAVPRIIPAADIVYGRVDYIDADGRRCGSFPVERCPARLPKLLAAGIPALTPQGTLISRRAFEALGGFDARLRFCGDFDFWLRASRQGLVFAHQPEVVGAFRLHSAQLSQQLAAAGAELAGVRAAQPARYSPLALSLARTAFRLRNLPLIFERRRLTGHWRSRALFSSP